MRKYVIYSVTIAIFIISGISILPRIIGAYHLIKGGHIINGMLLKTNSLPDGPFICYSIPESNEKYRSKIVDAIYHLQRAIFFDSDLSQAYLYLGRSYCLDGEINNAIAAYKYYINYHPNNPIGHMELASIYIKIWGDWLEPQTNDLVIELPLANFENNSSFCQKSNFSKKECHTKVEIREFGDKDEAILFQPIFSKLTYELNLPRTDSIYFRFSPYLDPLEYPSSSRVKYSVLVKTSVEGKANSVFNTTIEPNNGLDKQISIDLSRYSGTRIWLSLDVQAASIGRNEGYFAGWASPIIVNNKEKLSDVSRQEARKNMSKEFKEANLSIEDILQVSQSLCIHGNCNASLDWIKLGLSLQYPEFYGTDLFTVLGTICSKIESSHQVELCNLYYFASANNILANPNFESRIIGWHKLQVDDSNFQITSCNDLNKDGKCAIIENSKSGYHGGWYQSVRLEPGAKYHYSCWIKVEDNDHLDIKLLYAQVVQDGKTIGIGGKKIQGNSDWTYYETIFTALPSDDGLTQVYPILITNSGKVWIDNVELVPYKEGN